MGAKKKAARAGAKASAATKQSRPRKASATLKFYFTPEAIEAGIDAPIRAYDDDAGVDLRALRDIEMPPQRVTQVPTGIGFEIPEGYYGLICNRTSGGFKGILPMGHVVDAGYTGELTLILFNASPDQSLHIKANERVAQMVVMPVYGGSLKQIDRSQVKKSERGAKRLGSSGA
jgi:dUTP pyrophosphatase